MQDWNHAEAGEDDFFGGRWDIGVHTLYPAFYDDFLFVGNRYFS